MAARENALRRGSRRRGAVMVVRVGTWNLENLFRPGGPAGPGTQGAYAAKLAALAAVITAAAPDVLAVQEVGDIEALSDAMRERGLRSS